MNVQGRRGRRFAAVAMLLVLTALAAGGDRKSKPKSDFSSRFVVVTLKEGESRKVVLADAAVKTLGGRDFLVGDALHDDDAQESATWIAMEDVRRIDEYSKREAAIKAAAQSVSANASGSSQVEVMPWNKREVRIPVDYNADKRKEIEWLRIYLSRDRGQTWQMASKFGPDEDRFVYTFTEQGEYWFALQIESKSGVKEPSIHQLKAHLKLSVDKEAFADDDGPPRIPPASIAPAKP